MLWKSPNCDWLIFWFFLIRCRIIRTRESRFANYEIGLCTVFGHSDDFKGWSRGEKRPIWFFFFGYECYSDSKEQERNYPRTWDQVLTTIFDPKLGCTKSDSTLETETVEHWETSILITTIGDQNRGTLKNVPRFLIYFDSGFLNNIDYFCYLEQTRASWDHFFRRDSECSFKLFSIKISFEHISHTI